MAGEYPPDSDDRYPKVMQVADQLDAFGWTACVGRGFEYVPGDQPVGSGLPAGGPLGHRMDAHADRHARRDRPGVGCGERTLTKLDPPGPCCHHNVSAVINNQAAPRDPFEITEVQCHGVQAARAESRGAQMYRTRGPQGAKDRLRPGHEPRIRQDTEVSYGVNSRDVYQRH
jgi:hypothetical protein